MGSQRLIITDKCDGLKGVLCDTEVCRTIHIQNGCVNCPMFQAIMKKLNFLEDAVEEVKNEELCEQADNHSCGGIA